MKKLNIRMKGRDDVEEVLYSLGEALEKLDYGYIATSKYPNDEGAIFILDNDGWVLVKHAHKAYFRFNINLKKDDSIHKRWVISKRPEELNNIMIEEVDGTIFFYDFESEEN